jgi:hypothetical protein
VEYKRLGMTDGDKQATVERWRDFVVDPSTSRIVVRTQATGLLARFAHDLEIAAQRFEAELGGEGQRWQGTLRFPVGAMRVVGVVRKGEVDETVLSASDVDEIRQRMDEQVFRGAASVVVRAEGEGRSSGSATVELGKGRQSVPLRHQVQEQADPSITVQGRTELSLAALGVKEIKGPLGAFRVHDGVEVIYRVVLRPAGPA